MKKAIKKRVVQNVFSIFDIEIDNAKNKDINKNNVKNIDFELVDNEFKNIKIEIVTTFKRFCFIFKHLSKIFDLNIEFFNSFLFVEL